MTNQVNYTYVYMTQAYEQISIKIIMYELLWYFYFFYLFFVMGSTEATAIKEPCNINETVAHIKTTSLQRRNVCDTKIYTPAHT